ncbi:MAG: hypothetical protein ABSF81_03600 [Bacteroidales bacterium]
MHPTNIIQGFAVPGNLKKKVFIALLLLSIEFRISAPCWDSIIILDYAPIEPYKQLILAIGTVETKGDTLAYNPIENAAGYFQIRPIRLEDYNNRTGSNYTMKDLFIYETSEKIFLYFADQIGPYDIEQIARKWNGSGHLTIDYWNRIKQFL